MRKISDFDKKCNSEISDAIIRGRRLKRLRKTIGLTMMQVYKKYGISITTQRYWENGERNGLTRWGAHRVAFMLKNEGVECTLEFLLNGTGQRPVLKDDFFDQCI